MQPDHKTKKICGSLTENFIRYRSGGSASLRAALKLAQDFMIFVKGGTIYHE